MHNRRLEHWKSVSNDVTRHIPLTKLVVTYIDQEKKNFGQINLALSIKILSLSLPPVYMCICVQCMCVCVCMSTSFEQIQ